MSGPELIWERSESVREARRCLLEAEDSLREAIIDGYQEGVTAHQLAAASGKTLAEVVQVLDSVKRMHPIRSKVGELRHRNLIAVLERSG